MNSSLNVTAIVTDEVTAVEILGVGVDGLVDWDRTSTGWAKKHPRDPVDPEIAYNLAMSRALQSLANLYARNAAEIAGFPVEVDLEATNPDGSHAALIHVPLDLTELVPTDGISEEKVSY
jgi:hypothetical protein